MVAVNDAQAALFTADELRRRAKEVLVRPDAVRALLEGARAPRSDFDLNPELAELLEAHTGPRRPAAVLVPIVDRRPEASVLLTQRTEHLPNHAGQIAFPGGKVEPRDPTPAATALREAREEIGLDPALVDVLGFLDCYQSRTGFCIAPAVGIVSPDYTLELDRAEVADAFEVPLRFLMCADNHLTHSRQWHGARRNYYAMPYEDRYIWGVTAGILRNLYDWIYG